MANLQWQTVQNSANEGNNPYLQALAQNTEKFFVSPKEAMKLAQTGGSSIVPNDYYQQQQNEMAQRNYEAQLGLVNQIKQLQDDNYNLKVNQLSNGYTPQTSNYSVYSGSSGSSGIDIKGVLYKEFRNGGLDHNQALGLLMGIYAENGMQNQYVFGTHMDLNNRAYGIASWQGGREKALVDKLKAEGLYNENNHTFSQNERVLQLQAQHMLSELKSGKQGNYLNFFGSNPLDYARYADKTYFRSAANVNEKVRQGRESNYNSFLNQKTNWEWYLQSTPQGQAQSQFSAKTLIGQVYDPNKFTYGGIAGDIFGGKSNWKISSGFGSRNTGIAGASKWHPAVDIAVPVGTNIYSPFEEAEVYETGYDKHSGNYITLRDIRTGNFVQMLHGSGINFKKGAKVTNKDIVFVSGNTGISSGSHLDIRYFNKQGYAISPDGKISNYKHKRLGA